MGWSLSRIGTNRILIQVDLVRNLGWEQWVLLRSDVHHDNPKCDQELEQKHLEEALVYDAPVIDNGDLFCAMGGQWDKRASKELLREEHQGNNYFDLLVDTAAEFYKPYASIFAVLGKGNHETAITKRHETDLTDRLAAKMRSYGSNVEASGYSGWVIFQFRDRKSSPSKQIKDTKRLYHYHGSGGGGPVTRGTIQSNRLGIFTPDGDIVLSGHTHDEWTLTIPRQRISDRNVLYRDEQLHVRPPGYKDAWGDGVGGWEVEKMLGPKALGSAWLRFSWDPSLRRVIINTVRAK